MNTRLIALAIGFVSAAARAAGMNDDPHALDTVNVQSSPKLVVDCRDAKLPGYAAVGALLDTNNSTVLYAARARMRRTVQHDCTRGIGSIAFAAAEDAKSDKTSSETLIVMANVSP